MLNAVFIKIGWLLAALVSCYASSIQLESLETRLCRATFVFKFLVVTRVVQRRQHAPSSSNSSTTTNETTPMLTAKTPAKPPFNTTSLSRNLGNHSLPRQRPLQQTTPTHSRTKRFPGFQEQGIFISGDSVIRGKDKLSKIRRVQEFKNMYFTFIRLELGFQSELRSGEYLFIGRQVGRITDHVFLSSPANVVPWSKSIEQKMNNFDFVKDCKRNSMNPTPLQP